MDEGQDFVKTADGSDPGRDNEGHDGASQDYQGFVGRVRAVGTTTILELRGELDILAVAVLSDRLNDLSGARPDLLLDLRAVTFIDCAGLSLLVRARQRARDRGGRLRLTGVAAGGSVDRLLRMTGLIGEFEIVADRPDDQGLIVEGIVADRLSMIGRVAITGVTDVTDVADGAVV
ncbi:STAS domain-containing protein [Streptomyces piniterrae]|uniref:Anti-sigma factor antagonist n=2 Tax=Streptomyces piniterrae TaxID=2571125 RepID=A0A4U0NYP4_9ACTN|nr:STAS domain-containing protein [Streptomyces piniterrae]